MTPQLTPQGIVLTVLLFFVLVTIHEWGHYYFAKRAGILVREFAIGFGPKIFAFRRGETKYTLRLLPFGGYVRMAGEDPETVQIQTGQTIAVEATPDDVVTKIYLDRLDERMNAVRGEVRSIDLERKLKLTLDVDGVDETFRVDPKAMTVGRGQEMQIAPLDRQFGGKPVGKRAMAIFAGPMMNVILAAGLFIAFAFMNGIAVNVSVNKVNAGEPAAAAGIQAGDVIQSINGVEIGPDTTKIRDLVTASAGKPMEWVVLRDGQPVAVQMTPIEAIDDQGHSQIRVGVEMMPLTRPASFQEGITNGATTMWSATVTIFEGFKMLVLGQFTLDDLGGPIRMAEMTLQLANAGILYYTWWAAMLSLYLAIFNLLPVPALDGSRLIFLGLEAIRGRPVDPNRESLVHFIGFAMLMLVMVAVTYNDILRLFRG